VQAGETLWLLSARLHLGTPGTAAAARGSVGGLFAALMRGDSADTSARMQVVCERLVGNLAATAAARPSLPPLPVL
jgi:hypothetical protein